MNKVKQILGLTFSLLAMYSCGDDDANDNNNGLDSDVIVVNPSTLTLDDVYGTYRVFENKDDDEIITIGELFDYYEHDYNDETDEGFKICPNKPYSQDNYLEFTLGISSTALYDFIHSSETMYEYDTPLWNEDETEYDCDASGKELSDDVEIDKHYDKDSFNKITVIGNTAYILEEIEEYNSSFEYSINRLRFEENGVITYTGIEYETDNTNIDYENLDFNEDEYVVKMYKIADEVSSDLIDGVAAQENSKSYKAIENSNSKKFKTFFKR